MIIGIAGAGIGGLCAALCCARLGHQVLVFERANELNDIGAGIQIPPNAMRVLQKLGVAELVKQRGFKPNALQARMGRSGKELFCAPLGQTSEARWNAEYLHIHRADYTQVLAEAASDQANIDIRLASELIDFEQSDTNVALRFADGHQANVDVLIGADGIRSKTKEILFGEVDARFTGHVAWRAVVPTDQLGDLAPDPTACIWMGPGKHCVTYRLRRGELANLVAVVEADDWQQESWHERGRREDALSEFKDWHPIITNMLEHADELYRWALFDRDPLAQWCEGRVALLGDAAHPMLPFLAQGAAMAVEDAWVLAQCLSIEDLPLELRLKRYQQIRFTRTTRVQAKSRANGETFHRKNRLAQLATYGPMWLAGRVSSDIVYRQQDWLYAYDVTAISNLESKA